MSIQEDKTLGKCKTLGKRKQGKRSGSVLPIVVLGLLALTALAGVLYFNYFRSTDEVVVDAILKSVSRGEFVAKVLDQGEVQSAENVEIKCNVGSRNGSVSVIDVVPEGTKVKAGDWLVTLDSEAFEKELEQQRMAVSNADTQVIQSDASFQAALASKEEYMEGTFKESLRSIENDIFNAKQELTEAQAYLEHSIKLQAKGFITKQQLRSDEIAVEKADNNVKLAEQRRDVLVNITKKKEVILLDSDIAAAEVQVKNSEEARNIEKRQLEEIEAQLGYCKVLVPEGVAGEVVYHKEFDRRGGSEWVLEPGATVRERQVLIKLPNPDKMEVKVLVNEQNITAIRENMPATISVDALSNTKLTGYVTKVNSYAEKGGWGSNSAVREYAVLVRILNPPPKLIPGMNASVTIQTEYQDDVLQAPLQCIYAANNTNFVLKQSGEDNYETVEVKIIGENSQNVWIESGVEEGDMLVMDPGQYKDLMDLPEADQEARIVIPDGEAGEVKPPEGDAKTSSERDGQGKRGQGKDRKRGGPDSRGGGQDGKRGGGGGPPGGFDMDRIIDMTMSRYDTNEDGKIDAEEQEEFDERASRMTSADKDGDGSITREEVKAYMDDAMKRWGGGGGGGQGR